MNVRLYIPACRHWRLARKGDRRAVELADGHYSRRKVGSPQFMPPGQTIVLLTRNLDALWGWWRPHPSSGIVAMNKLDGWTCSIFRNVGRPETGGALSSDLVLDAERALLGSGLGCGPSGMLTYVWCDKVRSTNPGYCYQAVGWRKVGWSVDGKKRLLQKPFEAAGERV